MSNSNNFIKAGEYMPLGVLNEIDRQKMESDFHRLPHETDQVWFNRLSANGQITLAMTDNSDFEIDSASLARVFPEGDKITVWGFHFTIALSDGKQLVLKPLEG